MGQEKTARACTASLLLAIIAPLASLLPTSDEGTHHSFEGWRVGGMLGDGGMNSGVGGWWGRKRLVPSELRGGRGRRFQIDEVNVCGCHSFSTCSAYTGRLCHKKILFRFASRALLNTRLR